MSQDDWIAGEMIYVDHGEAFGSLPNLRTVKVGTEAEVMAALEEPSKHQDMVRKLILVGVEIGANDDRTSQTGRGSLEGKGATRFSGHQQRKVRLSKATKELPVR